ncbi:MAG: DUF3368 domain-containing protein [Proteobacteria bacterium]|nr:DUF3368 domain-containing protein [Pseudomonadota bacterium]
MAEELTHRHAPQVVRKLMDSDPKWLEVRTVKKKDSTLEILDPGEREAILLSEEIQSKIILLDDGQARQAAIKRNLACIGTLRILSEGANFDMIDLKESIGRLKQTTFRASAVLIHQVLDGAL